MDLIKAYVLAMSSIVFFPSSQALAQDVCQLEIPEIGIIGRQNPTVDQAIAPITKCDKGNALTVRVKGGIVVEGVIFLIGQYCNFDKSVSIDHEPDGVSFACIASGRRNVLPLSP